MSERLVDISQKACNTFFLTDSNSDYLKEIEVLDKAFFSNKDLEKIKKADEKELSWEEENAYYYRFLDSEGRKIYRQILSVIENCSSDEIIDTLDVELIDKVFRYVIWDHPEIFYTNGYGLIQYSLGDKLTSVSFSGKYSMTKEEIEAYKPLIDDYVNKFEKELDKRLKDVLAEDNDDISLDYEKIKFTYEYIILNTEYDLNALNNQNIISVMTGEHKSVCQGYSKAIQYLLNHLAIENAIVEGSVTGGEGHAWNLVKADGDYYYLDATWGDASYVLERNSSDEEISNNLPQINYVYMLTSKEEIAATHIWAHEELMPCCTSLKDNYFVREGSYFSGVDEERLGILFDRAYLNASEYVTIKADSRKTYLDLWKFLIEEQHIFEYLKSMDTVSYVEAKDEGYMIFWI